MGALILVIDDDPVAMRLMVATLTGDGFEVLRAYGVDDAVRKMKLRKPDLVLTDLEMPKRSGVDLITMIREDPELQDMPIIAVTAHTWDKIGQDAAQAGCDGIINKPYAPGALLDKVRDGLTRRHEAPAPHAPPRPTGTRPLSLVTAAPARSAAPPAAVRPPAAATGEASAVFDRAAFLEYVDGSIDLAKRAIAALSASTPDRLGRIRSAVANEDPEALRLAAHSIKGSVAFFAAPAVVAAAFRLEMMGEAGDLAGAKSVFFDLEHQLERLLKALDEFAREAGDPPGASGAPLALVTDGGGRR